MEDREQDRLIGEPFLFVGFHHPPRLVMARIVGVGEQAAEMIAPAHVAVLRFLEVGSRAGSARADGRRNRAKPPSDRASIPQTSLSRRSSAPASSDSLLDVDDRRGAILEALDVGDREAAGQHDQAVAPPRRRGGEAAQERAQALVLELARLRTRPVLQRLDAVEHEKRAPLASAPRRSPRPWRRRWLSRLSRRAWPAPS